MLPYPVLLLLILLLVFVFLFCFLSRRKVKNRVIKFVGPRLGGKTYALNYILGKRDFETVPTLEDYEVTFESRVIHEIVPKNNMKTFFEAYGIDDVNVRYFFFFNDLNDIVDYEKGFDVYFVNRGDKHFRMWEGLVNKYIKLENDPEKLIKYIMME